MTMKFSLNLTRVSVYSRAILTIVVPETESKMEVEESKMEVAEEEEGTKALAAR
jgi:hypothetical protein